MKQATAVSGSPPEAQHVPLGGTWRSSHRLLLRTLMLVAAGLALAGAVAVGVSPKVRVRAHLLALKCLGRLPDVGWNELPPLLLARIGFDLPALAATRNPFATLREPYIPPKAAERGVQLFQARCAQCHGVTGAGGHGPALNEAALRRIATDWDAYRILRDGLPGTAMPPAKLSFADAWLVINHVRRLQLSDRTSGAATQHVARRPVTAEELASADESTAEWLSYSGGWSGRRSKSVPELTRRTVGGLRFAWAQQLPDDPSTSQSTPLAVRGLLVVTAAREIVAFDQGSGTVVWRFRREPSTSTRLCCSSGHRGAAVFGNLVLVGTHDAHLLALDLATGRLAWDVTVADAAAGYSITGAPLVADGRVLVGVGGGDFGVRGFLDAYDATTGSRLWRFYTIPGPNEPGWETWSKASVQPSGGPTWVTGAYDPQRQLVYWGVGNPGPDFAPDVRPGDNLYTNSVIALDVRSGSLKWSYQFTPHDSHDWDSAQIPVLVDRVWEGRTRALILWANRNGFFYVLDRDTGEFLRATPFVKQTWNDGFTPTGRPIMRPSAVPTPEGTSINPGVRGATNWWSPSFSDSLGLMFVAIRDQRSIFYRDPKLYTETGLYLGGRAFDIPGESSDASVIALDVATGSVRWKTPAPERGHDTMGGLLAIGDRMVLGGQSTTFFALDARTGERVWQARLGAAIQGAPIVFRHSGAVRLAITAGTMLFVFEVPGS